MKREIYAVHDRDLELFLNRLGLAEALERGEIVCEICGCPITIENLGFISPSGKKIIICCEKLDCFKKLMEKLKG